MITSQLVDLYRRLAGRRDACGRNARFHFGLGDGVECSFGFERSHAYQCAIDDLCSTFGVTEDDLRSKVAT